MTAPTRILFICSHLVGRARAAGELARRLAADGHDIVFAAPGRTLPHLTHLDLKTIEIGAFKLGGGSAGKRDGLLDFLPSRKRKRLAGVQVSLGLEETDDLIDDESPDLILIDSELHPHVIVALGKDKRVAVFTDFFIAPPGAQSPPLDCGIVPRAGNELQVRRAWARLWIRSRRKQLKRWISTAGADYLSALHVLAASRNVPLNRLTTRWWWQMPFAWCGLPLIVLQGKEADFPAPDHPNVLHVGPMLQLPARVSTQEDAVHALARSAKENARKVVYISFGAMISADETIIANIWRALANCPDVIAIQTLGGHKGSLASAPPDNVHLVEWAPQDQLLHMCDAAIIHAGVNTFVECLAAGTPMLCIPRGVDCEGNTARAVYHGVGIGCTQTAGSSEIGSALQCLLEDQSYAQNCKTLSRSLKVYETKRVAEATIRDLLA